LKYANTSAFLLGATHFRINKISLSAFTHFRAKTFSKIKHWMTFILLNFHIFFDKNYPIEGLTSQFIYTKMSRVIMNSVLLFIDQLNWVEGIGET